MSDPYHNGDIPTKSINTHFSTCPQCHSENTTIILKTEQLPKNKSWLITISVISSICIFISAILAASTIGSNETIGYDFAPLSISVLFLLIGIEFARLLTIALLYHNLRPYKTETKAYVFCKDCGHYHRITLE